MRSQLEVTVECMNLIQEYGELHIRRIKPQLEKLIGHKVIKADGTISKKLVDGVKWEYMIKERRKNPDRWIWCNSYWSCESRQIVLNVKVSVNGGSYDDTPSTAYTQYYQKSFYLGSVDSGILNSVYDDLEFKTTDLDYCKEVITKTNEAMKIYEQAKSLVPYDLHRYLKRHW